jgi:hypothetical protein
MQSVSSLAVTRAVTRFRAAIISVQSSVAINRNRLLARLIAISSASYLNTQRQKISNVAVSILATSLVEVRGQASNGKSSLTLVGSPSPTIVIEAILNTASIQGSPTDFSFNGNPSAFVITGSPNDLPVLTGSPSN